MNSQTISTRANAKHFGQASATRNGSTKGSKAKAAGEPASEAQDLQAEGKNITKTDSASSKGAATSAAPHHEISTAEREIQFRLEAPSAHEVLLAADFTNWGKQPIKLIKGGGGVWHAKHSLAPGRHHYRFVVDGVWQDDPHCAERVPNPYGTANSVVEVH
jgi:1,4-alpha-glucan branching enzyme